MADIKYDSLVATVGDTTKAKTYLLDGNFTKAQACGAPVATFPFVNQGDTSTVYFRQKFEQLIASYVPFDLTKPYPGVAGAYPLGDINFRDGGCGVWEFERQFGNVPKRRIVRGQSYRYTFQYVTSDGATITTDPDAGTFSYQGAQYDLGTEPFTVDCVVQRDYFIAGGEDQFPLLQAPLALKVGHAIACRGVDFNGGGFPLSVVNGELVGNSPNISILAQDDAYEDWLGAMRCRVRRIIKAPTPAFWGANLR